MSGNNLKFWKLCIAIVAWMAQMLLAPAHAALMASDSGGALAWCSPDGVIDISPSLSAKLAELPEGIRKELQPSVHTSDAAANCALACATPPPGAAAPTPQSSRDPDLFHVLQAAVPVLSPPIVSVFRPDARGPPRKLAA